MKFDRLLQAPFKIPQALQRHIGRAHLAQHGEAAIVDHGEQFMGGDEEVFDFFSGVKLLGAGFANVACEIPPDAGNGSSGVGEHVGQKLDLVWLDAITGFFHQFAVRGHEGIIFALVNATSRKFEDFEADAVFVLFIDEEGTKGLIII